MQGLLHKTRIPYLVLDTSPGKNGLSVSLPSGARALTEAIRGLEVEKVTRHGEKLSLLAHWTAQVSGGHWATCIAARSVIVHS